MVKMIVPQEPLRMEETSESCVYGAAGDGGGCRAGPEPKGQTTTLTTIEFLAILVAISTILATLVNILQLVVAWVTLTEIGSMDGDVTDWWERLPWRRKNRG